MFSIILRTLYNCRLADGHAKGQTGQLFRLAGLRAHRWRGRPRISLPVPVSISTVGPLPAGRPLPAANRPCAGAERQSVSAAAVPVRTAIRRGRGCATTTAAVQLRALLPRRATVRGGASPVLPGRTATALRTADRGGRVSLAAVPAAASGTGSVFQTARRRFAAVLLVAALQSPRLQQTCTGVPPTT